MPRNHSLPVYAKQQESMQMAARFEHCNVQRHFQNISDKENKNTQNKVLKGNHLIIKPYLQERNIQNPAKAEELATVLQKFYVEVRTHLNAFCVFRAQEIF